MSQKLDSESSVVEPRLPPELERAIFERAAIGSPKTMVPVLCLVAWRVKKWSASFNVYSLPESYIYSARASRVSPILARTIVFRAPTAALPAPTPVPSPEMLFPIFSFHTARALFSSPSAPHPAGLIRAHLEHVIVSKLSWAETALLFTKHLALGAIQSKGCTRILSVSLVPQPVTRQWPVRWPIAQLPRGTKSLSTLTHLSIGLYDLLGFVGPFAHDAPSSERRTGNPDVQFKNLTHLQLLCTSALERSQTIQEETPPRLETLAQSTPAGWLPALTHLAAEGLKPEHAAILLAQCGERLRLVVLAITSVWGTRQYAEEENSLRILDDARVVFYLPKEGSSLETDWSDALAGRENIWERAERYLGRRKAERNIDLGEPQLLNERT